MRWKLYRTFYIQRKATRRKHYIQKTNSNVLMWFNGKPVLHIMDVEIPQMHYLLVEVQGFYFRKILHLNMLFDDSETPMTEA